MPNVRASNKVKIGAWVDKIVAAKLRRFAASQGLHLSTLIEETLLDVLQARVGDTELEPEHGSHRLRVVSE